MIAIIRKWITIIILIVVISLGFTMYIYYQSHPKVMIETQITSVDDKTYGSIGGLDHVKYPEKENFKQLKSTIKVSYSSKVEDVEIELSKAFVELLGKDIYWTGEYSEDIEGNVIAHYNEIILYMGETNEQQLKEMLSKGIVHITWKLNGKIMSEKHTLDQSIVFK